MEKKIDKAKD